MKITFKNNIAIRLLGWSIVTAATTIFAYCGNWALAILCFAVWVFSLADLINFYHRDRRKIAFTFDALDNKDYNFKFTTKDIEPDEVLVNESLNRIKQILQEAGNEARQKEKYYEMIINSVDTGILVVDEKGNVLQKNDQALRLLGISVLTNCSQLAKVDDTLEKIITEILPGEKKQASFQDERGIENISLSASSTTLDNEKVRIIAVNDINSELDENELDSWIKLIRVLTHEIMNSVTPITSLSETLLSKADDNHEDMREGLTIINSTSRELMSFVDNYRKFTHIPTPVPSLFYVKPFAERMKEMAIRQNHSENLEFIVDVQPEDLLVYADENLISHVMTNLLKNAVQAISESGIGNQIRIKAYTGADDSVMVEVSDNGPKIPHDVAEHIFVPFFTTKKDGSGIGLSISRQIMRLSGGTLTLRSDTASGITTFVLKFQ
jgi:nitrogen fixation/metabolism regulation signal transduction histidine kinase